MIGFEIFDKDLKGIDGYQYEIGKIYETLEPLEFNRNVFNFCEMPIDIMIPFDKHMEIEYALIEALGSVKHDIINHKSITNKIKIIKKLDVDEILNYCKDGKNKTNCGDIFYFKDKKLHSENDLPAVSRVSGNQEWYSNGIIHRNNDLPAIIYPNGDMIWYMNGMIHRDNDLPAIIRSNGFREWYVNGMRHRSNDLPAIICSNGDMIWYMNGMIHRDNDLPAIIRLNNNIIIDQEWYHDNKLHRDTIADNPALIINNTKAQIIRQEWYINGLLHRNNDKPAIITIDYDLNLEKKYWYKNGICCRDDNKPSIVFSNGNEYWMKDNIIEKFIEPMNQI